LEQLHALDMGVSIQDLLSTFKKEKGEVLRVE
jgi:hypothetical protein